MKLRGAGASAPAPFFVWWKKICVAKIPRSTAGTGTANSASLRLRSENPPLYGGTGTANSASLRLRSENPPLYGGGGNRELRFAPFA